MEAARFLLSVLLVFCIPINKSIADESLLSDLAFHVDCGKDIEISFEKGIEAFFISRGFAVVNVSRIQAQRGAPVIPVRIIALDKNRNDKIIDLMSFKYAKEKLFATLVTRPPTKHDVNFEESFLEVVKGMQGCKVSSVSRNANGVQSLEFYESQVRRTKSLIQDAEKIQAKHTS